MNHNKKSISSVLSNPFGPKPTPSDISLKPHSTPQNPNPQPSIEPYPSREFKTKDQSSLILPPSIRLKNLSFIGSQQGSSRIHTPNPLKRNLGKSTDVRRAPHIARNRSIDQSSINQLRPHDIVFNLANPFENFISIIKEIEHRDAKVKAFELMIKQNNALQDSNEIKKMQRLINEAHNRFYNEEHKFNELTAKNNQTKNEIESTIVKINVIKPQVDRQKNMLKPLNQLQAEVNALKLQLNTLRCEYGKKAMIEKIRIEQEFKNKIERQLYDIALEVAKDSKDPKVINIYNKIKGKKLDIHNAVSIN